MTERDIFQALLELTDPAARVAYLDRACGEDVALRERVEALLRSHQEAGTSLGTPAGPVLPSDTPPTAALTPDSPETAAFPGDQPATGTFAHIDPNATESESFAPPRAASAHRAEGIGAVIAGRYTLVEVIGEGGMGSVYLASQSEPVKRQVALKLIKAGMDSKAVLARFDAERQALALMDHPNIARVYDGGTTPSGQPFFVMELVKGVPLTQFCDNRRLSVKSRLELFVQVCQAVQHAHQKGIIHRDLKPGNVLVTEVDGRATPKVIDFGVAKATELKLTDLSFADAGVIVGTPAYMSPEQADPSSMDIDTRTDVYALGIMLYELLVGSPPIDASQFKRGAILEMLRMVREVEPPRPSTKVSMGNAPANVAANRNIEPAKLAKLLQGELDWVVMKALEKDRTRRYETANGLARDVQRYLADEVVEARPPSTGYRVRKFVRRHKGGVAAAGLVLMTLLIGLAAVLWQMNRAIAAEGRARTNAELASANEKQAIEERAAAVLEAEAARKAEAEATTARAAAQEARLQAEQNAQIAGIQATLALNTVQSIISQSTEKLQGPGLFEIRQGLLEVALENVNKVADIYDKAPTSKEATTAAALVELGSIYRQLGQSEKSSRQFLKALDIAKERIVIKKGSDPSRRNLAIVYSNLGATAEELNRDMNAALDYHLKALALFEDIDQKPMLADSPMPRPLIRASLSEAYKLVGVMYYRLGRLDEALPYYQKSYNLGWELAEAKPNDPGLQVNLTKATLALGSTAYRTGDRAQAAKFLAEARDRAQKLLAARPNDLLAKINLGDTLYIIGETHLFAGQLPEARADMQSCLKFYDEIARAEPRNVYYQRNLSKAHYRIGSLDLLEKKPDEARAQFEKALKIRTELVGISKDNDRRQMELMLAQAQVGQVDAAVATADRLAVGPKVDSELRMDLARCYAIASRTRPERAQPLQVKAMEALRAAVKDGYSDRGYLAGEPDIEPLRDREDFKKLMAELEAKAPKPQDKK